jgi:hypothetical protein
MKPGKFKVSTKVDRWPETIPARLRPQHRSGYCLLVFYPARIRFFRAGAFSYALPLQGTVQVVGYARP